ncbi:MAG: hypothetical protein ACI4SF_02925 [Oscillospiraceae bacterium]
MDNQIITEKAEKKSSKLDKLASLKAEQEKRLAAVAAAEKKAKAIAEKIEAEERKRHDKEIRELDGVCKKNNISYAQIIIFCKYISEKGFSIDDIMSLIGDENNHKEEKSV